MNNKISQFQTMVNWVVIKFPAQNIGFSVVLHKLTLSLRGAIATKQSLVKWPVRGFLPEIASLPPVARNDRQKLFYRKKGNYF